MKDYLLKTFNFLKDLYNKLIKFFKSISPDEKPVGVEKAVEDVKPAEEEKQAEDEKPV